MKMFGQSTSDPIIDWFCGHEAALDVAPQI